MPPDADIYESDPDMAPDSDFEPGSLALLVAGNTGRLLDPRRTPVTVVDVEPERGSFTVRVDGFEDAGARWELFLAEAERFQFDREGAQLLAGSGLAEISAALARFDHSLCIDAEPQHRDASLREIGLRRRRLATRVREIGLTSELVDRAIESRVGNSGAFELTQRLLDEHELASLERDLLEPLISNPRSGEMVKGHAIVLAELGLCPYQGRAVRDPHLFDGGCSKDARTEHVLWRMALAQEIWAHAQRTIYRVISSDGEIQPTTSSLVSATFSESVAESHVDAATSRREMRLMTGALPLDRLFMTFLETGAMNEPFSEAEALLVAPSGSAF